VRLVLHGEADQQELPTGGGDQVGDDGRRQPPTAGTALGTGPDHLDAVFGLGTYQAYRVQSRSHRRQVVAVQECRAGAAQRGGADLGSQREDRLPTGEAGAGQSLHIQGGERCAEGRSETRCIYGHEP